MINVSLIIIEGLLKTHSWQDSAGVKHFRTEIIVEQLQLGPKGTSDFSNKQEEKTNNKKEIQDEEIPIIEEESTEEIDVKKIPF